MSEPFEVAIVGAGPVGTALAILLAQRGRSVVIVERWPEPYVLPRAVHFDHEVGRILQSCGIGDELAAISEPAEVYEWRNATGTTLLRFGRVGLGASGWPESSMFNQPALEGLLAARAEALAGITIRRGTTVTGLDQDGDGVTLAVDGSGSATISASFVVGCDGANSTVRTLIGAPVHDLGFFYDWLIVDVILAEPRVFDPINLQICDPARPVTAVSGGPGRRRWEFMRLPDESLDDLGREERAWELLADWDVHPGNATLERHAVYTFQARWVEQWRRGRVLLAGDAAHQMPPFAGQGLCAGMRDAANLAWKLDLVLDGAAPHALLDAYEGERTDNVQAVIGFSMELGKVICVPDPAEAAARDEAMAGMVVGETVAEIPPLPGIGTGIRDDSALAGLPFLQGRVTVDGETGRFDDRLGAGWRLVGIQAMDLPTDLAAWFAGIGGRVVAVGDGADVDGTYARWFAEHGIAAVLQRPDFHLFGTVADADEAGALVDGLRLALGARGPL